MKLTNVMVLARLCENPSVGNRVTSKPAKRGARSATRAGGRGAAPHYKPEARCGPPRAPRRPLPA